MTTSMSVITQLVCQLSYWVFCVVFKPWDFKSHHQSVESILRWFTDRQNRYRLVFHRYDQSNTMYHLSIITLNYLWLPVTFKQMCRWIIFKKCRWVVFNCVDELSPKTVSMSCLVDELSRFRVGRIKTILFIVYTVPNVHHCYHCFKGKCCSWFECLLSCDTIETVMHYHQNPYVHNITGLHRNYEHKRQIKAIKDCFITWKMI